MMISVLDMGITSLSVINWLLGMEYGSWPVEHAARDSTAGISRYFIISPLLVLQKSLFVFFNLASAN
jgi:hypothetical protein